MSLYDYIEIKNVQFIPKWYYGFMENFEEIKKKVLHILCSGFIWQEIWELYLI